MIPRKWDVPGFHRLPLLLSLLVQLICVVVNWKVMVEDVYTKIFDGKKELDAAFAVVKVSRRRDWISIIFSIWNHITCFTHVPAPSALDDSFFSLIEAF